MEKFDSKKEKIPKTKDIPRYKKFLSDKYLNRKYASKELLKELSTVKIEKYYPQQPFSEINSSSDDSSTTKDNVNSSEIISSHTQQEDKDKNKFDEIVEQNGVKIFIDAKAQLTLLGTEMDYVKSVLSSEFVFNNPNIKSTCGCGESFQV